MATTFTVLVAPSGGDYTSLATALNACPCDLTSATTKVFSHSAITGTMSDNAGVTGLTSGATGTCLHCSSSQILIASITGTFQSGEIVYETLGTNLITISNAGDSCQIDFKIDGSWASADTTASNIAGYTTSATNFINVYTTPLARHNGSYSTSAFRIESTSGGTEGGMFGINPGSAAVYINLTGIQGFNTSGSNTAGNSGFVMGSNETSGTINVTDCIFRAPRHSYTLSQSACTLNFTNCVGIPASATIGQDAFSSVGSGGTANCYNCVFIGGVNGVVQTGGTLVLKNCYAYNASGTSYTGTMTLTTCASSDASGSTGLQNIAYSTSSGAFFTNVTSGSENFHINRGSKLISAGTNLSSTFNYDIVGAIRGILWDIGIFNFLRDLMRKTLTPNGTRVGSRQLAGSWQ